MNKIALILYTSHDAGPSVPFSDEKYQRCYEVLYEMAETEDLHLCRAPLAWYDPDRDIFRDSWEFVKGQWRLSGPVRPDLVYDKTGGQSAHDATRALIISRYRFIDDPAFTLFANDKYETSRRLPQHFKPYRKLSTPEEFTDFLKTFTGQRIVIKPIVGSGGRGVHIVTKEEAARLNLLFPVIVQEFIDSSCGISGITDTYHDLRMVFIGDELVYAYIRTPKEGSFLANVAQGGNMKIVPNDSLPQSLNAITRDVQKLFSRFPQKTYTIDVMFDETGQPWIIEFNTMPGMYFPPEEEMTMRRVYARLLKELKKFLETTLVTAVIISTPRKGYDTVPFEKDFLREAYTRFSAIAEKQNVKLYRAPTDWYDETSGSFTQAWHWDGNAWVLSRSITPDVIYDKAATNTLTEPVREVLAARFPIVNHPAFSQHAGDKLEVSRAFKDFAKPYSLVTSTKELTEALAKIPGETAVLKPERGNSGEGVLIGRKSELAKSAVFPAILQEFVDSSVGIPGVMQGLHDLRLIYCDETLVYAYYRTPKPGSYLANVARGGKQTMLTEEEIPPTVWPIVRAVQAYYREFSPKIYTIDLIFDPSGKPWIVELNTMPGLYPDESERPHIEKLYRAIAQALKIAAQKE
jgi:glutathione synthase/RimK-type ligase-like ATP-grasp enzyme